MSGRGRLILLMAIVSVSWPIATIQSTEPCSCANEYPIVGESFTVHGRLSQYNGNPTRKIWIVGTKRMLGIREGTPLPANVDSLFADLDDQIFGDFVVCPLTECKPGAMQVVCVQSASKLVKTKRNSP